MKYLDLTLPTPSENLACDEALLDCCEETGASEVLRIWEPVEYFVVVGYANKIDSEVNRERCAAKCVPILRRCSGGGTVLQGPGCLNYSVILNLGESESLKTITETNRFVMERHRELFQMFLGAKVQIKGHTDLVLNTERGALKFSGNAQRRKKNSILFHGTFLLEFDIPLIEQFLRMPSQQPGYRDNRSHDDFVTNLHRSTSELKNLLRCGWKATETLNSVPALKTLLDERYNREEWNLKF